MSARPDCIFEIHQPWESGFSRVYSNCCCSCWLEPEIIKIGQSSHNMYSNNILNFQESTTILNASTKKYGNLLKAPRIWHLSPAQSGRLIFFLVSRRWCIHVKESMEKCLLWVRPYFSSCVQKQHSRVLIKMVIYKDCCCSNERKVYLSQILFFFFIYIYCFSFTHTHTHTHTQTHTHTHTYIYMYIYIL